MKSTQILENFFEEHRRQLKKESNNSFKTGNRPNSLLSSQADQKNKPDRRTPATREH